MCMFVSSTLEAAGGKNKKIGFLGWSHGSNQTFMQVTEAT